MLPAGATEPAQGGPLAREVVAEPLPDLGAERTVLRALAPEALLLGDARSIELDIAAAERRFSRPVGGGFAVRIRIAPATAMS